MLLLNQILDIQGVAMNIWEVLDEGFSEVLCQLKTKKNVGGTALSTQQHYLRKKNLGGTAWSTQQHYARNLR